MAAAVKEIRVQPHGAQGSRGQDETFQMSNMDLLMPKLYVHMIEVFELPPDADKDTIIKNLAEGLARTLDDYPILAGTLHFDNENRRIVVKKTPDSSVGLYVKTADVDDIPSFSFLDEKDFPVHLLDASKVLPQSFVTQFAIPGQDIATAGAPVLAFQVNFVQGGLVLALAVTHQICDGNGCEALLDTLARHSAAATMGTTYVSPTPLQGREVFISREKLAPEELERLGKKFPTFKAPDTPAAPPPADAKPPVVKTRIWHIPLSKLQQLKSEASAVPADGQHHGHDGSWISSYDAILALLWRAVLRAKLPLVKPESTAPSKALHAVNGRGRTNPPLSGRYIGSAVTLPQSERLTVAEVLADGAIPKLARNVRACTNSITPEYVADLVRWSGACNDLRWTELDVSWVLGLDCMAFDWHTMKSYHTHDYGFGKPRALRWPNPQFEGFFFVLPSRKGVRVGRGAEVDADEGIEICLGLEESCYPRFETDEELLRYAEPRGVGV